MSDGEKRGALSTTRTWWQPLGNGVDPSLFLAVKSVKVVLCPRDHLNGKGKCSHVLVIPAYIWRRRSPSRTKDCRSGTRCLAGGHGLKVEFTTSLSESGCAEHRVYVWESGRRDIRCLFVYYRLRDSYSMIKGGLLGVAVVHRVQTQEAVILVGNLNDQERSTVDGREMECADERWTIKWDDTHCKLNDCIHEVNLWGIVSREALSEGEGRQGRERWREGRAEGGE